MLQFLLWALRHHPLEALVYLVLLLLMAIPVVALVFLMLMLIFDAITSPFEERRTLEDLGQRECPFCGNAFGLEAAKRAAQEYTAACAESRRQNPRSRINRIREWRIICPNCQRKSYFNYSEHILYDRELSYRNSSIGTLVRNCDIAYKRNCPGRWEELQPAAQADTKLCPLCQREVFLCVTPNEALDHAEQGHIIAQEWPDFAMQISAKEVESSTEADALRQKINEYLAKEDTIQSALDNVKYTARRCVNCGFPVPEWWKKCRVCGSDKYRMKDAA